MSKIVFRLKNSDRDLLLQHVALSDPLQKQLRFGVVEGKRLSFEMPAEALERLCVAMTMGLSSVEDRKVRRRLETVLDQLEAHLPDEDEPELDEADEVNALIERLRNLPEDASAAERSALVEALAQALNRESDEIDAQLEILVDACADLDREDCLGLAQEELEALIFTTMGDPESPVQFRPELPDELVAEHGLLYGAVAVLRLLASKGWVRAHSKTGEFPGAFLREAWGHGVQAYLEPDAPNRAGKQELALLRDFCHRLREAGLVDESGEDLVLSEDGRWFLNEATTGERLLTLFDGYFANPDPETLGPFNVIPFLVDTLGYSLYAIHKLGDGPWNVKDHWFDLFLPSLFGTVPETEINAIFPMASGYVILIPLEELGLVRTELVPAADGPGDMQISKTPLFDAFIAFPGLP